MKIEIRKHKYILIQIFFLLISVISFDLIESSIEFSFVSFIALIYFLCTICSLVCYQKKFFTAINCFYCVYVLFQIGVPLLYAVIPKYSNPYMSLFSEDILVNALEYTLLSLEIFGLTIFVFLRSGKRNYSSRVVFTKKKAVNDERYVYAVAKALFICTGMVTVPLYTVVAYLTLKTGFSQVTRALVAANGLFNLARALFIPAFFLLIIYGEDKKFTKFSKLVFFYMCIASLLSGIRTDGILWLLTYLYTSIKKGDKKKLNIKYLVLLVGIVVVAIYVGQSRVGSTVGSSVVDVFVKVVEEMGFNFTTICFVMMYVPSSTKFQMGGTYLKSILAMYPNSLDFLGIFRNIENTIGCQWLNDQNHVRFGSLLDFGSGFSAIGESYMNFGWGGILVSCVIAIIVTSLYVDGKNVVSKWDKFVETVLFLALLTFPRRAFNEFVSNIEYSIFIIGLILIVMYHKRFVGIKNNENQVDFYVCD